MVSCVVLVSLKDKEMERFFSPYQTGDTEMELCNLKQIYFVH